jgi:hypothetical protein
VRRLAEGAAELTAEVRARKAGRSRQLFDPQRLEVTSVGEVLRAKQMADGRDEVHLGQYRSPPLYE